MKRKRLLTVAAVLVALATAALSTPILVSVFSRPAINRETFDRIQIGMTRRELYECLGWPPGYYAAGWVRYSGDDDGPDDGGEWWHGDNGAIAVYWDEGQVSGKRFREVERSEYNRFQKLVWHFQNGWRMVNGS